MDFLQGPITTIHRLDPPPSEAIDRSLGVVVPMAGDDVNAATARDVLATVDQLEPARIVIPLRGTAKDVDTLSEWSSSLSTKPEILRCNGPQLHAFAERHGVPLAGKGSDVWLALGIAAAEAEVLCCVDADVRSLDVRQLRRLVATVDGDIAFSKAYYTRIEESRPYGRLCRLLYRPLVLALGETHHHPLLSYLQAFRYPLAGEFAIDARLVDGLQLPSGMGLEVGLLGEAFELAGFEGTCQVDLGNHEHTHRPVSGDGGLVDIAGHVTGALYDVLDRQAGIHPDLEVIADRYERWALRLIEQYERDARANKLTYNADEEREQVRRYRSMVAQPHEQVWTPRLATISKYFARYLDDAQSIERPST